MPSRPQARLPPSLQTSSRPRRRGDAACSARNLNRLPRPTRRDAGADTARRECLDEEDWVVRRDPKSRFVEDSQLGEPFHHRRQVRQAHDVFHHSYPYAQLPHAAWRAVPTKTLTKETIVNGSTSPLRRLF